MTFMIEELAALVIGLVLGAAGQRFALRKDLALMARQSEQRAADRLLPALRQLRDLARGSRTGSPSPQTWSDAVMAFHRAADDVEHVLPEGAGHLAHSVRAAVGEHAGAVTFADIDGGLVPHELPPAEHEWLENLIAYLEHAIWWIQTWRDLPHREVRLLAFDAWLRRSVVPRP